MESKLTMPESYEITQQENASAASRVIRLRPLKQQIF
jgi:hypothetical protein